MEKAETVRKKGEREIRKGCSSYCSLRVSCASNVAYSECIFSDKSNAYIFLQLYTSLPRRVNLMLSLFLYRYAYMSRAEK